MATPSTSPYANPLALQTAVLHPPATQAPQQSYAARRSFKSFVEAMDDFGGDRRDVAGMRQMLAMQEENRRLAAAQPPQPAARSFAPAQAEPEVPVVVRGQAPTGAPAASLPKPNIGNVVPGLPQAQPQVAPAAVQSSALPALPAQGDPPVPTLVIDPAKIKPAAGQLPSAHPAAQRIVAYAPMTAAAPPASPADQALPAQLRSPVIDQVREATRAGRPGVSDETMARFAAAAERRRGMAAPMPPRLQAQEARWNRDAWQATIATTRPAQPRAAADATTPANAPVLPRLPAAPTVE